MLIKPENTKIYTLKCSLQAVHIPINTCIWRGRMEKKQYAILPNMPLQLSLKGDKNTTGSSLAHYYALGEKKDNSN